MFSHMTSFDPKAGHLFKASNNVQYPQGIAQTGFPNFHLATTKFSSIRCFFVARSVHDLITFSNNHFTSKYKFNSKNKNYNDTTKKSITENKKSCS